MKKISLLFTIIFFGCVSFQKAPQTETPEKKKYNVLFIAIDDLKPYINSFGYKQVKTPNLDKLAKSSTIFNLNYCQQAVCAPSRASIMTGLRPDKTEVWDLKTLIRDKNPNVVTLPQHLKANGFTTSAMGKIFDPRSVDKKHDEVSWSEPWKKRFKYAEGYEDIALGSFQSQEIKDKFEAAKAAGAKGGSKKLRDALKVSTESSDVPDDAYFDGAMTKYVKRKLNKISKSETQEPFFMAVGFHKPHLPFVAPKKYWDLYERSEIEIAAFQERSKNGPEIAYHKAGELRGYSDIAKELEESNITIKDQIQLSEDKQKELIHGYYACVSYIDNQIGQIINTLKNKGLAENTIIVLWGDHGWHLGDHNLWAKHSNFEQATAAPLLISVPGITKGKVYEHPTEFVDVYPTLLDLAGLDIPAYLDGSSLVPALKNNATKVKDYAISQYPRKSKGKTVMGYSLRTGKYRYTEWIGPDFTTAKPFSEDLVMSTELYDLENDPLETVNIANEKAVKDDLNSIQKDLRDYYQQQYQTSKTRK